MNPSLAHALFTKGIDTYDIAKGHGCREAEVVEALIRYREMKRADRPVVKAMGQCQAQDVRI
jgi:hypothetical protein